MWVRGLKHSRHKGRQAVTLVAPYVGAWIETCQLVYPYILYFVAPYVGAWIETALSQRQRLEAASHPMWVRGLKPL